MRRSYIELPLGMITTIPFSTLDVCGGTAPVSIQSISPKRSKYTSIHIGDNRRSLVFTPKIVTTRRLPVSITFENEETIRMHIMIMGG